MRFAKEFYPTVEGVQERVAENHETTEALNEWVYCLESTAIAPEKVHQQLIDRLEHIRQRERDRPIERDDGSDDFERSAG